MNIETEFSQFAIQIFYFLLYSFQDIGAIKLAGIWVQGGRLNLIIGMPDLLAHRWVDRNGGLQRQGRIVNEYDFINVGMIFHLPSICYL